MSETEIATVEQELERTIQYPIALNVINTLATEYMPLKISGITDKDGQAEVREARLDVKKHRMAVEHKRKALKADALAYGKKVDSTAKLLTSELVKIESHLIAEETAVTDEIARITQEEEERKQVLLQERLEKLTAVDCVYGMVNPADIEAMDDNQFAKALGEATERHEESVETERQRKAEEERLAAERKKLEEEKAELEAERAKVEAEKQRVEKEWLYVERQVEDKRLEAERKIAEEKQREKEAKAEREQQKRLEAMRPDIEKLARVADALDTIRVPRVASDDAQPKREQVVAVLRHATIRIREITSVK